MTKERTKEVLELYYQKCEWQECDKCSLNDHENECSIIFFYDQGRADAIEECANKFAEILSNMTQICGNNCPIKCNWGTEDTCKDMCKKWFIEQLKEQK